MSKKKGSNERDAEVDQSVDEVRRKLLRAAVYVPPAIVSAVLVQRASAQPGPSCSPSSCNPGGPCSPSSCSPSSCSPSATCSPNTCGPTRPGN